VLLDPTVRVALRFFAHRDLAFRSGEFVERLAALPNFPAISVGELLAVAREANVRVTGVHAAPSELAQLASPFLTYLKRSDDVAAGVDLFHIVEIGPRSALIAQDRFGTMSIPLVQLLRRWTGIVLLVDAAAPIIDAQSELEGYRAHVSVTPNVLTRTECAELIDYCERMCFRRSRVAERRDDIVSDVIQVRTRSSSTVALNDRSHPLLAKIYRQCAMIEGVDETYIETIQCVRYKHGQKYQAHFDGGIALPRLTTFLLYLNDDFTGGETYFPMLDHSVVPVAGSCLRFSSCDRDGRILWQSEHGGLPVRSGIKYALNIWVRTPDYKSKKL
jgi:hypothetical protein